MIPSSHIPLFSVSGKDVLEILNLFSAQNFIIEKFYSEISNYLYPDPIPKITKHHITQVEERLHHKNNLTESLSPIKNLFKYDPKRIIKYAQHFPNLPPYSQILIIYSVISFLSIPDLTSISSSFLNLLDAIVISKNILSREHYVFSLSSCIIRFLENSDNSSTLIIAQKAIPNVKSDIFQLFTYLMVKSLKRNDQETFEYLIITLYDSIIQNPKEFENCNFLNALSFLSQKILAFDPLTLKLIDSLTYVRQNDSDIKDCLESIPLYFQQHTTKTFKICNVDFKSCDSNQPFRFSYDFEKKKYFTNGLVPLPSDFFDKNFSIDVDVSNIINLMSDFLQNLEKSYFDYFFNNIPIKTDLIYLIFIKLISVFSNKVKITDAIFNKILNPVVFTSHVTLFDYKEEFNNIFYLRKEIFDIIMKNKKQLIITILVHFNSEPLLFSEFIGRLHCNLSLFDTSLLANEDLISSIVQVIMMLKKDNSESYQKARSTLDLFIFSIFKDEPTVRNKFFGSSIFVSGYFTSIFEPTLQLSIVNSFLSFLQNFNSSPEQLKPAVEMISTVINFCEDDMAFSILHSITEILTINPRIKKHVTPFIDSITNFLHLHPSRNFLNETVQLYLHCEHQFQMRQIRDLSDSIHNINGDNDPDDQLVLNFLCLISNSHSASLHNRFSIFNEALLITFFSIFQTSQKAKPIFDLFYELCKYSPFNCYKFNKAEIDLLFIEMIKNYPSRFNFRGCRMNSCIIESKRQILDILCLILTVRSSIPVCLEMISLLKYSTQELDLINILLSHLATIKKNIQPIGFCNPIIETYENGIRGKDIDNGFSFQFWMKVDEAICHYSSSTVTLISVIDDHIKMSFKINSNGSLMAEVKGTDTVHTAIFKNKFPSGVWLFITLAFRRPEKSTGFLYFSMNGEKYDRYTMKNLSHFSHNYATIKVGKLESMKPIKSVYPLFFGDYFFYSRKLKNKENIEYFQKGEYKTDFLFRNKSPGKVIFPHFLDNFLTDDVHHFILPYFYLSSENDSLLPNMFLEALLNILTVSIGYHEKVDIDFKIYAYALKKSDKITFTLYQRFFSILDNSITKKTMKSLVYDILLNFEIWTRAKEPSHLYRITQNWGNSLFDSCSSVLTNFSYIYQQIPVYFSFTDPKNKSIDIGLCRSSIDKLLISIASVNFTNENAISILSNCASSDDFQQVLCNFELLYRISLIRNDFSLYLCELLFYFLKPKKEKQFVAVLKIIYSVSKLKFPKFVDSILCLFNEYYITLDLFNLLMEMMPSFPMIYPLVIFVGINLKDKIDLTNLTNSLQKLKIPFLATNWLLMPLILFTKTKSFDIVLFCSSNMVDHFSIDAFEHSLNYINFLSSILNFDFDEFTLKFAKINVDFMNNDKIMEVQLMFTLCSRLLLINNQQTYSFKSFIDENQISSEKSIFNLNDFQVNSAQLFEFNSTFDDYLIQIQKNISNQIFYFSVKVCPLMTSVIRIFQTAQLDLPLFQIFCQFFIFLTNEKKRKMKLSLLNSLNSLLPFYYENVIMTIKESNLSMQKKQMNYWSNAKSDSIKFMTAFGREDQPFVSTEIYKDESENERIENQLQKNVFSQFSIWSHKKLYLTEVRRVFQYSKLFHQIRLKKSSNMSLYSIENSKQATLNINPNLNANSNSNSNASSIQDSDYSSTFSDPSNSCPTGAYNNVVYNHLNSQELSENAFFKSKCILVKVSTETPADFTLRFDRFIVKTRHSKKIIMLYEIEHIFKRNRFQIENSIEFILVNGHSLLLDFSPLSSSTILLQFRNLRCDNLKTFEFSTPHKCFENSGYIEKWQNREISNFEYLMALNVYSGRTFNDSNLYPIFPWILTNYSEFESIFPSSHSTEFKSRESSENAKGKKKLNLSQFPNSTPILDSNSNESQEPILDTLLSDDDEEEEKEKETNKNSVYSSKVMNRSTSYISKDNGYGKEKRNLSKPIAIQTEEKFHEFNLKFSIEHPISHLNCFFLVAPSSSAIIAHWLIRQPPFTQLHLKTESGKFGYPTRLFQTMSRAVYQAMNGTISWELCPEFFSFPEIFINMNKYKLGDNVKNDVFTLDKAIEFIYIHRKALESEEVSTYLNNWIDLIFGCKTKNIKSGNIYSPILCEDVWKTCSNKYSKNFIIDTLKVAGQLPQSIFSEPHPKRKLLKCPYTKSKTQELNTNQNDNNDNNNNDIFSPTNITLMIEQRQRKRQKLQSKIIILTDKVDINEMLNKEKSNIISQMKALQQSISTTFSITLNENSQSNNETGIEESIENIKIKHATFLKKISTATTTASTSAASSSSSDFSLTNSSDKNEEYVFLVELAEFVIGTIHINFDKKICHLKLSKEKNYKSVKKRDSNNWNNANEKDILYSNFSRGFITANRINNEIFIIKKSSITQFFIHYNNGNNNDKKTRNKNDEVKSEYFEENNEKSDDLLKDFNELNNNNNFSIEGNEIEENEGNEIEFLFSSGSEFCISNSDGRFDIYNINQIKAKPVSFNFMYERISCFTFSQSYGVIVIGTVNGYIYIVDSKTGFVSFRSSVLDQNDQMLSKSSESFVSSSTEFAEMSYVRDGKIPRKIIVTEGFGFIVVYCDDLSLFLFNINGTLIRKRKLNFAVTILFSFKSNCGFDFIVSADSKGGIRFCEAFYLDFDENPNYICRSEILSISYDLSYDAILVTTKNGVFFRIPTNSNQWIY